MTRVEIDPIADVGSITVEYPAQDAAGKPVSICESTAGSAISKDSAFAITASALDLARGLYLSGIVVLTAADIVRDANLDQHRPPSSTSVRQQSP